MGVQCQLYYAFPGRRPTPALDPAGKQTCDMGLSLLGACRLVLLVLRDSNHQRTIRDTAIIQRHFTLD